MPYEPVDEFGFNLPNSYLTLFIPPTQNAMVFRVRGSANGRYRTFSFGQLGSTTSDANVLLTTIGGTPSGAAATPPAAGTIGGFQSSIAYQFALTNAYDSNDMWYYPEDYRDRLFEVAQVVTPQFLRVAVDIPNGTNQEGFQKNRVPGGVSQNFGFRRGKFQVIHLPKIHYGYRYANDTNLNCFVRVKFAYAEYFVEVPDNPETIFSILQKDPRFPTTWRTLPVVSYDPQIKDSLIRAYGFEGFPLFGIDQKPQAIAKYRELIGESLI